MLLALVLATISTVHPRVYVRADNATAGEGITISELRARMDDAAYTRWRTPAAFRGLAGIVERAARYLEAGDAADLAAVREHLQNHTYSYRRHDVSGFLAGAEMAMAYDWTYHGLSPSDRTAALKNIAATCDDSMRFLESGGADINHNYTYMALNSVAVCGLVLHGEPEPYGARARQYLAVAERFLEGPGMALDTWKARQCAWGEGSHYTFFETLRNFVATLQAYRTASSRNYFEGRAWLAQAGRFLIASTRPDLTFERIGDTSANRVQPTLYVPVTVEMLAAGLGNTDDAARLRSFNHAVFERYGAESVHPAFQWGMRMFYDARAPRRPDYTTLPRAMRLGEGTYEHIAWRNGWGPDSTLVTILAGDHFTDHQHFDKGQFLIYHRGGLAVDSGAYDGMYKKGGHSGEYAARTLAHNCLLIYDPNQDFKGFTNDGGQLLLRGIQHHNTWDEFLEHREREGLDAANVVAYQDDGDHYYAAVDLTRAYGPKVRSYQRSFVYLPRRDVMVVYDRVDSPFEKRWLMHCQDQPEERGGAVTVRRPEGGSLTVRALLPARRDIALVGGPGREYWNPFNKTNYPPSRPATAAPSREPGSWRMETIVDPGARELLHALSVAREVPARALEGAAGAVFAFTDAAEVVAFPAALPASYRVDAPGAARHFVAGLPPGTELRLEIGSRRRSVRVNAQGVVQFEDGARGARTIRLSR